MPHGGRRRSGRKIDFTHWTGFNFVSLGLAAGSAGLVLGSAQHLPETLMRTRGSVLTYLDGVQAPGVLVRVGLGMILVPEGTSTTVLWSPITDEDAPWWWYSTFELGYEEQVVDVVACGALSCYRQEIESKAMRVVKNMELQLVVENETLGSASAINVAGSGRFLSGT